CRALREKGSSAAVRELVRLCHAALLAYAALHRQGVLHGDVHERNALALQDGSVKLIDFDRSRFLADRTRVATRFGVAYYFEPEYARAVSAQLDPPTNTARSEQYAIAVLLYFLLTGRHYLDFDLDEGRMLAQIADQSPLPLEGPDHQTR